MQDESGDQCRSSNTINSGYSAFESVKLKLYQLQTNLKLNPRFSRWALRFWPARRVARKQAGELFDLVSGFVYSQILRLAIKVNLLEIVKSPVDLHTISQQVGLDHANTARLLRATTALKLTRSLPFERYGLGSLGMAVLINPGLVDLIEHHDMLYRDLGDPLELFKSSQQHELGRYWSYAKNAEPHQHDTSKAAEVRAYSDLMAASQPMISDQLLLAYPFEKHNSVLDLGGGTGQFLRRLRQKHAQLSLTLFDLPSVSASADQSALEALDINHQSGDFFHDSLPTGADLITLVRIIHDHNDNAVIALLKRAYDALPHNGTVLIAEPLANTPGAERMGDAYFNLYFLAMGKGEPRSYERIAALLKVTGFESIKRHHTSLPLVCSVISATASKTK